MSNREQEDLANVQRMWTSAKSSVMNRALGNFVLRRVCITSAIVDFLQREMQQGQFRPRSIGFHEIEFEDGVEESLKTYLEEQEHLAQILLGSSSLHTYEVLLRCIQAIPTIQMLQIEDMCLIGSDAGVLLGETMSGREMIYIGGKSTELDLDFVHGLASVAGASKYLKFNGIRLDKDMGIALMSNQHIRKLSLRAGIDNDAVVPLFRALEHNTTLTSLKLSGNTFTICGWEQSLPRIGITELAIPFQSSTDPAAWPMFRKAFQCNASLTTVRVAFPLNPIIRKEYQKDIDAVVKRNRMIQQSKLVLCQYRSERLSISLVPAILENMLQSCTSTATTSGHLGENPSAAYALFQGISLDLAVAQTTGL